MTAVPSWDLVDPRHTDAELVGASMAGDRAAFAQIYDRYADRLHDFCVGMLRDFDAAADCVQETFCLAATRLPQLREPDKLRPWLYAIARNESLRRLRDRQRETPSDELPDIESDDASPDTLAARTELADLIAEAAGGLTDRDRAVFDLAFRHGLNGPDLADALGVSHTNANTMVQRLRGTIERSLGALLVCRRRNPGGCAELGQILAGWDGQFTVLMRKRVSRHIESCPNCDEERRRLVSPAALLAATPAFIPAPKWLRDKTLGDIQLVCHASAMDGLSDDEAASHHDDSGASDVDGASGERGRRRVLLAALLIAVLGTTAGLMLAWLNREPTSILPTEISGTSPTSQATFPISSSPTHTTAPVPTTEPVAPLPPAADLPQVPGTAATPELIPSEPPPYSPPSEPAPRTRPTAITRSAPSYSPTRTADPTSPGGNLGGGNQGGSDRNPPPGGSAP